MRCKFETEPKINTFEIALEVETNAEDPETFICDLMEAIHRNCMYTIKNGTWERVEINGVKAVYVRINMETVSDLHSEKEGILLIKEELEGEFEYFIRWRKKHGYEETSTIGGIGIETAAERERQEKERANKEKRLLEEEREIELFAARDKRRKLEGSAINNS